ncbi:hypothetical protein BCR36DRAFT_414480 [Piromyces finnis]|uniref:Uncharacterized protein n=1 Tax=Piromyces finnis TaxID=1754191 RepID=A0A1Y1V2A5_9FUNG|nr:hypothetical protein BCR36DRAFT_414480 [Piromyces finnis]|eukprot:ORX45618.1 hypothetical protein BCR36DRAFT_414480 [Piromyces finnis]
MENSLIQCISNNNFTVFDLDSIDSKNFDVNLNYINKILCEKNDNDKYHDLINTYSIHRENNKNKIIAFTYFSNIKDMKKFSSNVFYMNCNHNKKKSIYNNNNHSNIQKFYNDNNNNYNVYFKRQDNIDEVPEEEASNTVLIYVVLIIIFVAMVIGAIIFAIIHKIQDNKKEKAKEEKEEREKAEKAEKEKEVNKEKKETKSLNISINKINKETEKKESKHELNKHKDNEEEEEEEMENSLRDISNLKNALEDEGSSVDKKQVELSNDYYYQDYNQKSPILYNNKKSNLYDNKNPNLLKMSNRPHSNVKNLNQNRISVNPSCLPEIKFRPESLMFEAEFAQEVSKIFKNYDESFKFSSPIQNPESVGSQRINRSQTRDSMSNISSKRNSKALQINRQSKNIKRKNKNAVKKRISQNRSSMVILPFDMEGNGTSKRASKISSLRESIILKGTYNCNNVDYYFNSDSETTPYKISPLNCTSPIINSPISANEISPSADFNITIESNNINIKKRNRISKNLVKTNSNVYVIEQLAFKVQCNDEADKYNSVNVMVEDIDDSLVDEDSYESVGPQVENNESDYDNDESVFLSIQDLKDDEMENFNNEKSVTDIPNEVCDNSYVEENINNKDENSYVEPNENANEQEDNSHIEQDEDNEEEYTKNNNNKSKVKLNDCKLSIVIDSASKIKNEINKEMSSTESVTFDVCESMFDEQNKEDKNDRIGLMSPICESDYDGNKNVFKDNLHLCRKNTKESDQFSVNIKCQEDNCSTKLSANSNINLYVETEKSIKRNTFGFFDVNSEDAIRKLNENINKRMTLSNEREFKDVNNC